MTRSLPSVSWVKDVSVESGATGGGGDGGGGGSCLRAGARLGPIAITRGPLIKEKDLPCREAETSRPVVLLICNDRSPAVAVSVSPDSATVGFALSTDCSTWSSRLLRSSVAQT